MGLKIFNYFMQKEPRILYITLILVFLWHTAVLQNDVTFLFVMKQTLLFYLIGLIARSFAGEGE